MQVPGLEAGLCLAGLRRPDLGCRLWSWAGKFVFFQSEGSFGHLGQEVVWSGSFEIPEVGAIHFSVLLGGKEVLQALKLV